MIEISQTLLGFLCLVGGLALTFLYPLGRKNGSHLVGNLIIVALFVTAAFNLIPVTLIPSDVIMILLGLLAGGLAVAYRSVRRWVRYFKGVVKRRTSPYYWYQRAYGSRRRRRQR